MSFQIGYASVIRVSQTEYRNYTVAHQDVKEGIMDIVSHIHSNGVGSQYMDTLEVGDELFMSNPRGKKLYDPSVTLQFFFGDETSLGLASSFLPVLKQNKHRFQFYFELEEFNKRVPSLMGLEN